MMVDRTARHAMRPLRLASSSIAIGAAAAFIALATTLSFVADPRDEPGRWALRGTIAPGAADRGPAPLPAALKGA